MEQRHKAVGALLREFLLEETGRRLSATRCAFNDFRDAFLAWCARRSPEFRPLSPEVRFALEQHGFAVANSPPPGPRFLSVARRR